MEKKLISLVIPAYREENNISLIYQELNKVLNKVSDKYDYEIIFINDGSPDNTWEEISKVCEFDYKVKWIDLSRNFGKEIALTSWIEESLWDAIITLDCDWQHPVEKIPEFIEEWEKWYQIVYNKRPNTKWASILKKFSSKIFYSIFNTFSEFKLEPWTTDYRILDRVVVNYYLKFSEKNRLYRWLIDWLWFNKKALVFDASERFTWWVWSYSYKSLFNLAVNSMTSFSLFPLKLVWYLWILITFLSTVLLFIVIWDKLLYNIFTFSNIAIVIVLNTILMWIVMSSLWLIALYIARIHEEVLWRPMYIIKDKVNFK